MLTNLQRLQLFDAIGGLQRFAHLATRKIVTEPISGYTVTYTLKNVDLGSVCFGYVVCDNDKLVVAPFHWEPVTEGYEALLAITTRRPQRRR